MRKAKKEDDNFGFENTIQVKMMRKAKKEDNNFGLVIELITIHDMGVS